MREQSFARWKWALVVLLGLIAWQFIKNAQFIAVTGLAAAGLLETFRPWIPAIQSLSRSRSRLSHFTSSISAGGGLAP
ncbi:MAG: hypothetical protein HC850_17760, partial [Rhodomicrobium sp.]|nr:hypothetical protein [Rhodomicrobium sp.]